LGIPLLFYHSRDLTDDNPPPPPFFTTDKNTMKATAGFLTALALGGALAVPVVPVEEKSPYLMPGPVLGGHKINILKPILGSGDSSPRKPPKDGYRDLRLKKDITLAWKNGMSATHSINKFFLCFWLTLLSSLLLPDDALTQAVLKANWNDAPEYKVINMEDFDDLVEDVDCTAPHLFIDFKRAEDISNAIREWGWVNDQSTHKLVVFANHAKCGEDATREPFLVTAIKYDKKEFRADMQVEAIKDFESVIPEGVLEIDTLIDPEDVLPPRSFFDADDDAATTSPASPLLTKTKRADATMSLSLNRDMSGNIFRIQKNGNYVSLDCTDCGTRGYLRAKAYVHISWFRVKTAYVEFRAEGVEVRVNLLLEAHLEHHVTDHKVLVPLMVYVGIPKIIALRFGANLGIGWDIGFEATGRVGWGIVGKMDNSLYRNCLKGCSDVNQG